jgi:hypothetical protein
MGNARARIFCGRLDAELPAIDGLYPVASSLAEDLPAASDRDKELAVLGQLLMRTNHQIAALVQYRRKAIEDRALQLDLKIGEDYVAAENEIETAGRKPRPDVLAFEGDPVPMGRAHAVVLIALLKRNTEPMSGGVLHAAEGEAGSFGSPQHHLIHIRSDHLNFGGPGLELDL